MNTICVRDSEKLRYTNVSEPSWVPSSQGNDYTTGRLVKGPEILGYLGFSVSLPQTVF